MRDRQAAEKEGVVEERAASLEDVRKRLDVIRAETEEHYKRASDKRDALERVQLPEKFSVILEKQRLQLLRAFHFKIWHPLILADHARNRHLATLSRRDNTEACLDAVIHNAIPHYAGSADRKAMRKSHQLA